MIYIHLLLSVVFNTLFALCYKTAARRGCDLTVVNGYLYFGATGFLLLYSLLDGHVSYHPKALALGVVAGACVFVATLTFFYHMLQGTLSVSWAVIGLSVAFPVVASIWLWHEYPTPRQIIGLLLIPAALVLFSVQNGSKK